jgi:hypothetical protein
MSFEINETVILLDIKGLPNRCGERAKIINILHTSPNYDYDIEFDDHEIDPVRETELIRPTDEIKQYMEYIYQGNKVLYWFDDVTIQKVDYLHKKAEIKFEDLSSLVVDFEKINPIEVKENDRVEDNKLGYFGELGLSIGKLVDEKQRAYGDSVTKCYEIMKVLLKDYKKADGTYIIPESLLPQMLLDIRKIDKLNRRFSNPDGDLMEENSFQDDVGYSLLGVRLIEQLKKDGLYD